MKQEQGTMGDGNDGDAKASQASALNRVGEARVALEQACRRLRADIEQHACQGQVAKADLDALREDVSAVEDRLFGLEAAIDSLEEFANSDRPAKQDERVWTAEMEIDRLKRKLAEQAEYRDRLTRSVGQSKRELEEARTEIAMLRGSFSLRLGNYLVAAARSPKGMILLPLKLLHLARDAWPRVQKRIRRGFATHDANDMPDLGPDLNLTGDAAEWASRSPDRTPIQRMLVGTDTAPQLPLDLAGMRIATIMDEFSFNAFRHCGDLRQVGAEDWRMELEAFAPQMLLVESAWKGRDESWARKVYPLSRELVELIAWCRERRIPTVFWNKEDPVHLSVFMRTARQFDFVFTTDIDCVRAYKAALGHDQVYWLPFACQPREHNPIEEYQRKDGFCFAGSFYAKYPDRQRDFATLVKSMGALRPFEIFDRNAGKDDPALAYPEQYQPMIQGELPYERISLAYKGYRYGININTVKQSQSMFARRAFDLLACNTVTVSNYSRGLRNLLGDLVISSDSAAELRHRIEPLLADDRHYRRFRLAGLRKVMSEHTYQDRLRYVLEKVGACSIDDGMPRVLVVGRAETEDEFSAILASFRDQEYGHKGLKAIVPDMLLERLPDMTDDEIEIVSDVDAGRMQLSGLGSAQWVGCFHPEDHYGANYLTDIALATRYSDAMVIGKAAYHEKVNGDIHLVDVELAYTTGQSIPLRRAIARVGAIAPIDLLSFARQAPEMRMQAACSIDEFNYCAGGVGVDVSQVDDLPRLWTGISQSHLHHLAETATAADLRAASGSTSPVITAQSLAELLPVGKQNDPRVSLAADGDELRLHSSLPGDKHVYLYATRPSPVEQLFLSEIGKFNFVVDSEMLISFVLIYLDKDRQRIGHAIRACSSNLSISPPAGTCHVRLGLRIQGPGTAAIKRLVLGHVPSPAAGIPGCGEYLVVTRGYPSYDNLYSYAYVHRRVQGYAAMGTQVDVFRLTEDMVAFDEFEGVDVVSGQLSDLELMIRSNPYKSIQVHSLDRALWSVLKECASDKEILVWVHGAEIQPWYRRDFSFLDERDRERGIQRSNDRMAFWKELLSAPPSNIRFVFVSRHLAREVARDTGIELDPSCYTVIHNYIDEERFSYAPKGSGQRNRLLSIRPYSRPTYANELTVKAILDLVDEPFFHELEFRLIGDGRLFDQTVEPVIHLPNVIVEKRFLTQQEIARLHKEYGVFLCPSRIDSQGVSRDEAMASGLVPITNRVSAIPEFVDESCALLVEPEDWRGMADAVRRLHAEPETFHSMSRAAADRVRRQSGREQTIERELALMQAPSMPVVPAHQGHAHERKRLAVYGDLDLNLVDGSSTWAASITQVLAGDDEADVDLFLKTPIRNTSVLRDLLGLVNVRLIEPPAGIARRQPVDAVDAILEEDAGRGYDAVIMRGFVLAREATTRPALHGRLWLYLTDIPHRREDASPEQLQQLHDLAQGARLLLCQTPQLARHLTELVPAAAGKTRLLPPMVPDRQASAPRQKRSGNQPLRIAYAGKFAPLWGIRELFDLVAKLRSEGLAIELHVFGDKIHNPPEAPDFRGYVKARLEGGDGVIWHGALDRASVLDQMQGMDVGWAWRSPELEECTLELSTKLLEYAVCGVPPILAPGPINVELFGTEYPLFATADSLRDVLHSLLAGDGVLDGARERLAGLVGRFSFASIRAEHVAPLLAEAGSTVSIAPESRAESID